MARVRTDTAARAPVGSGHVLEIDALERTYGSVRALDGMSFTVRPGAVTGFLGPNGAGKTTAMRAIFGLTALDGGAVRWQGRPVDAAARRRFGYLPEERGLYPTMRVGDQLRLPRPAPRPRQGRGDRAAPRRGSSASASATASRSNLEDLSLGNQQRIQLISALVHEPDVLILDEPFSGLDPIAVDALSKILVSEARRGATVLFSSHQLDLVEHLCEDAVIVDHGRVVAQGPLDELAAGHDPVLVIDVPDDPDAAWTAKLDPARFTVLGNTNGTVRLSVADGRRPRRRASPAGARRRTRAPGRSAASASNGARSPRSSSTSSAAPPTRTRPTSRAEPTPTAGPGR